MQESVTHARQKSSAPTLVGCGMKKNVTLAQAKNVVPMWEALGCMGRLGRVDVTPSFRKNKPRGINASAMADIGFITLPVAKTRQRKPKRSEHAKILVGHGRYTMGCASPLRQ